MKVQFNATRVWRSSPPGIVISADAECAAIETVHGRMVEMRLHRPDRVALADIAVVSNITTEGPQTHPLAIESAKRWAGEMRLNSPKGAIEVGEVLLEAWAAHQEMYKAAREQASGLVG